MRKFTRLLVAAVAAAAMPAMAGPLYFHVRSTDGNIKIYDLEKIDRLTFSGDDMTLQKDGAAVETFKTSDLKSMEVNESESKVNAIVSEAKTWFAFAGKTITAGRDCDVTVADLSGVILVEIGGVKAGQSIDLSALPSGTYIITDGSNPAKIELK